MTAAGCEGLLTSWNDDRDGVFFRITATLFPATFVYGAGVLLASYDDECARSASAPCATLKVAKEGLTLGASISRARLT